MAEFTDRADRGWTLFSEPGVAALLAGIGRIGGLDTSVLAYWQGEPVGRLSLTPEHTASVILKAGRTLHESEKLNILVTGCARPPAIWSWPATDS